MRGQWILVLLCLSIVGELVLGSLFPPTDPQPPNTKNTQTEVKLQNVATIPEVIFHEAKTTIRDVHAEDDLKEKLQMDRQEDNAAKTMSQTTNIKYSEQTLDSDSAAKNVATINTEESTPTKQQ